MTLDEAIALTIAAVTNGTASQYGYDLYPDSVARAEAFARFPNNQQQQNQAVLEWSPIFYDAAWELCGRGILRPGIKATNQQAVQQGGYSLTERGSGLLDEFDEAALVIVQPGALAATLSGFHDRFGDGFNQRAQEAIRCRDAGAWLACCAMVGAAAESILLALAIGKTRDEEAVVRDYRSANGRRKLLNAIAGQAAGHIRSTLTDFSGIISYWRDEAAHGQATELSTANADEALRQLLHMCQWVNGNWDDLSSP